MKASAIAIMLLLAVAATPLAAQDRSVDLNILYSQLDVQGSSDLGDVFETDFESGDGYGLTTNIYLTNRFALELAAFRLESDAAMELPGVTSISLGSVDLTPVSAGVQFHPFASSRFDPYIGGGVAYIMADDLESPELTQVGVGSVELDTETTWFANAGIGIGLTRSIGLVIDGRYLPYEPNSTSSVTGGEEELDLTSLVLSAGLRFRF